MRPRTVQTATGALIIVAVLVLTACGNSGGNKTSAATGTVYSVAGAAGGVGAAAANGAAAPAASAASAPVVSGPVSTGADAVAGKGVSLQSRDVVRTATLSIEVPDVSVAAASLNKIATKLGGRVDEDDRSAGKNQTAQLVLRVLPNQLDAAMAATDGLGHEIGRTVKGQDVTASAADINARVKALQTSVGRLQSLLGSSSSLPNLISLESELTQRQASLDSIVAQQRALSDQIDLASLTVNFTKPTAVLVKARAKPVHLTGFPAALRSGGHALALTVAVILAGLGYSLPFFAIVAVILIPLLWVRRRRRDVSTMEV